MIARPEPALPAPARPAASKLRRRIELVLAVLAVIGALAYPFAVWLGMTELGARGIGLVMLALVTPVIIRRARRLDGKALGAVLEAPLAIAALALVAVLIDDIRAVLALPVLINAALLLTFARSLRSGASMVEHFARLLVSDLGPDEIVYCRRVTLAWCVFFVVNGLIAGVLAAAAPLTWWVAFTGFISYLLMGAFFTVEVLIRFHRFNRTGMPWVDRLLARLWRRGAR